jgi:hypothetical protein
MSIAFQMQGLRQVAKDITSKATQRGGAAALDELEDDDVLPRETVQDA